MDLSAIAEKAGSVWLVWLMVLFIGIVFWAFRPRNRRRFERDGEIPFHGEKDGD